MSMNKSLELRVNDWVEVRSKEEILSTLDRDGRLEQMPFMPEMLQFCGQRFQVGKRAHKTCDPVNGLGGRSMPNAVHLGNVRCDGSSHGGCQAGCLIFWKDSWLKRVNGPDPGIASPLAQTGVGGVGCTERDLLARTVCESSEQLTYVCQATQVATATTPIKWWDVSQYIEDYRSGNASLLQIGSAFTFWLYHSVSNLGLGLGAAMRWTYDLFQKLIGGAPYPWRLGRVPSGARTPTEKLGIQEGELVRIKKYTDILETLDTEWKNRGLYFDGEMVPYTSGTFRVLKRVDRIIDEKTGKMLKFKNEALILDNVVCQARYAKCRKLCPRAYYLYWREIWLERAEGQPATSPCGNSQ
jgi:hypothetical protein